MSFTSPMPRMMRNVTNPLVKIQTLAYQQKEEQQFSPKKFEETEKQAKEKEPPKGNILHVSNISTKLTYEQIKQNLYKLFSVHGPIYEILIKTKDNGQHFAFIDFPDIKDAEKAWLASKKEKKILQNKELLVNYCEDPKKNNDRKSQKCFLCHGMGHKAIKCPVKPEMIKPKTKKLDVQPQFEDQSYDIPLSTTSYQTQLKQKYCYQNTQQKQKEDSEESQNEQYKPRRDKDYLRFLKLKKMLLEQKLKKKIKKLRKRKN